MGIIICVIHLLGFVVMITHFFAITKFYQSIPQIPVYFMLVPIVGSLIFNYVFVYKSWIKYDSSEILSLLDKSSLPEAWDAKHKILVTCLTGNIMLLVTLRIWSLDDSVNKLIFELITENEITQNYLAFSTSFYNNYVHTISYLFPVYTSYICICINIVSMKSQKLLHDLTKNNNAQTINENMEKFMKHLNIVINIVSKVDSIYNINIFLLLIVSWSNMALWLYLSLGRCHYFDKRFVIFASDAFGCWF